MPRRKQDSAPRSRAAPAGGVEQRSLSQVARVGPTRWRKTISLTAHEVKEAIEERIVKGLYARGDRLPPLRSIAVEFGTSPSTVSRAVQEMIRSGWLEVQERQFVRVRERLPNRPVRHVEIERVVRSIANKWKLSGGDRHELLNSIEAIVAEAFQTEAQFIFTECNADDLNHLGEQLAEELPNLTIARVLMSDLDPGHLRETKRVVLVPYYHFAEVKALVGEEVSVVPVHTSPSPETLDELLTVPANAKVLVVGHNKRSVARLSSMVRDYVDAKITGIAETETDELAKLAPQADVVFAVWSAARAAAAPGVKRIIVVRFALETSVAKRLRLGVAAA